MSIFYSHKVAGRGSETQLQVWEKNNKILALTLMTHGDDKLCTCVLFIGTATIPFINALTTVQYYLQGVWGVDSIDMPKPS